MAGKRSVGVTATASIPIPVAPVISASANAGFNISGSTASGSVWQGAKSADCDSFVPMYRLKALRGGPVTRGEEILTQECVSSNLEAFVHQYLFFQLSSTMG